MDKGQNFSDIAALLLVPLTKVKSSLPIALISNKERQIREIEGLAEALFLTNYRTQTLLVNNIKAASFFGSGQLEAIGNEIKLNDIKLVIIALDISPIQQRNLEKIWGCKVIDRTALILEIFSLRAQSREGVLQVELARLTYQKSRLVRSWTHLERQRGGRGFLAGPGETQLESDKRQLQNKINRLKSQLAKVVKTRALHRRQRQRFPVIALVGYTNCGKSTLFNLLTKEQALAKDMLFATLDPLLRRMELANGESVILSDTVGFLENLPTTLIAAFRATLEEVVEADLILHVRDFSYPQHEHQAFEVRKLLKELSIDIDDDKRIFEVWNKIDLLDIHARNTIKSLAASNSKNQRIKAYPVSALTSEGIAALKAAIERHFFGRQELVTICLAYDDFPNIAKLYSFGAVVKEQLQDNILELQLCLRAAKRKELEQFLVPFAIRFEIKELD